MAELDGHDTDQQEADEAARRAELLEWISWRESHKMLNSELTGLYDEVDKLVRVLPKESITPLQLRIVNSFVRRAKNLLSGDSTIDEIEEFGVDPMPEYRDVVLVLRQIRQGMERFEAGSSFIFSSKFDEHLEEYNL